MTDPAINIQKVTTNIKDQPAIPAHIKITPRETARETETIGHLPPIMQWNGQKVRTLIGIDLPVETDIEITGQLHQIDIEITGQLHQIDMERDRETHPEIEIMVEIEMVDQKIKKKNTPKLSKKAPI